MWTDHKGIGHETDWVEFYNKRDAEYESQIASLRAALEAREGELERARDDLRVVIEKVADERLPAYRELGERAANAENERAQLRAENAELRERVEALGDAYTELQERVEAVKRWAQDKARSNMWPTANEITNYLAGGFGPYRPNNEESDERTT